MWITLAAGLVAIGLGVWLGVRVYRRRRAKRFVSNAWLTERYRHHGELGGRFWEGDDS